MISILKAIKGQGRYGISNRQSFMCKRPEVRGDLGGLGAVSSPYWLVPGVWWAGWGAMRVMRLEHQ